MHESHILVPIVTGIILASACGFRVFLPPLIYALAAKYGIVDFSESLTWLESDRIINVLIFASIAEILSYLIPWLDNILDLVATPAAMIAGVILVYVSLDTISPDNQWLLASLAGIPASFIPQIGTSSFRAFSSAGTAGLANPLVSLVEDSAASILSVLAILTPILGLLVITCLCTFIIVKIAKKIMT